MRVDTKTEVCMPRRAPYANLVVSSEFPAPDVKLIGVKSSSSFLGNRSKGRNKFETGDFSSACESGILVRILPMDPVEQTLLRALQDEPNDWSIRFVLAEKMIARDAEGEAITLIAVAPEPPKTNEDLEKVARIAGVGAIGLVEQFIADDPTAAYGHVLLAHLLEEAGDFEKAEKHHEVALALSGIRTSLRKEASETPSSFPFPSLRKSRDDEPEDSIKPFKPPKQLGARAASILVAVAFHFILAIIATLLIILPKSSEEPEIVAAIVQTPPKKKEMTKKAVVKKTEQTTSAAAAAAPLAQLMRANAVAKISMPQITKTSTGPLGIGESDFGTGGFGSGATGGLGQGETMFGAVGGSGMKGIFYDLKQTKDKKPSGFNVADANGYYGIIKNFAASKFDPNKLEKYYTAEQEMTFTNLLIPDMSANIGPEAFAVEKEVKPMGWFVHYSGRVVPPETGNWRWVGRFDDAVLVYVNDNLVFDGSWIFDAKDGVSNPFGKTKLANGKPPVAGKWVNLSGPFKLDVFVGERPGGIIGGALLIEKKSERYKKRGDGTPIIPLFTIEPLSTSTRKRLEDFQYEFATQTPVFKATR